MSSPVKRRRRVLALLVALAACAAIVGVPASAAAETGGAGQVEAEAPEPEDAPAVGNTAFDRQGMWIWYVSRSESGSYRRILSRAKRSDLGTVYVKSGDGAGNWGQFSRGLVKALHRGGLDVCAWQFVYGDNPLGEARVGAAAVQKGADCLVIDAEADYEGKYAAADRYVRALRARIGAAFPLSLAGFPYVDYHPSFPYSVFFGPGGATYNQPQVYWKTIGTSVRAVFEHTYLFNRVWGHPIYPIGQTYEAPGNGSLRLFRRFASSYGGLAPSWWSWQETGGGEWAALGASGALRPLTGYRQTFSHPRLKRGARGDLVVWAQEHLAGAGAELPISGLYGKRTVAATRGFQRDHGLPATGRIDTDTWRELLDYAPFRMRWAGTGRLGKRGARSSASQAGAGVGDGVPGASARGAVDGAGASGRPGGPLRPPSRPLSASLPAKAYEIPPGPRP